MPHFTMCRPRGSVLKLSKACNAPHMQSRGVITFVPGRSDNRTLSSTSDGMASSIGNATLPSSARCVVVGGGVVGCSTAYHLALSTVSLIIHDVPTSVVVSFNTCALLFYLKSNCSHVYSACVSESMQEIETNGATQLFLSAIA